MSSLHREVMVVLLGDVAGGNMAPGEQLPTLTQLAAQFGVSTGVVRECQRALAERGVLSVRHGRRAVVNAEERWDVLDHDVLTALVRSDRGGHVLGEYLDARRVLEVEAAGLAAARAPRVPPRGPPPPAAPGQPAGGRASATRGAEPLYRQADVEFHKAI